MRSIVDNSTTSPAVDTAYFPNTVASFPGFYWSASPSAYNSGYAWHVDFNDGDVGSGTKSNADRVRLVRGGQ